MGTYFRILWERRNTALLQKQNFKETRYKCVIMLMFSALDFEKNRTTLQKHGRDFCTKQDLIDELKAEWHNMALFASDEILKGIHAFVCDQSYQAFSKVKLAMRKDLWGGRLSKEIEALTFE